MHVFFKGFQEYPDEPNFLTLYCTHTLFSNRSGWKFRGCLTCWTKAKISVSKVNWPLLVHQGAAVQPKGDRHCWDVSLLGGFADGVSHTLHWGPRASGGRPLRSWLIRRCWLAVPEAKAEGFSLDGPKPTGLFWYSSFSPSFTLHSREWPTVRMVPHGQGFLMSRPSTTVILATIRAPSLDALHYSHSQ